MKLVDFPFLHRDLDDDGEFPPSSKTLALMARYFDPTVKRWVTVLYFSTST